MTLECIKIWKFDDAPGDLKVGYNGRVHPEWLTLVPWSIKGPDVEQAIRGQSELNGLCTYQTESGNVVYVSFRHE